MMIQKQDFQAWWTGSHPPVDLPWRATVGSHDTIHMRHVPPGELAALLDHDAPSIVLVESPFAADAVASIRARPSHAATRLYVVAGHDARDHPPAFSELLDVEPPVAAGSLRSAEDLTKVLANGLRAHLAVVPRPHELVHYLDTTYNEVFDWFETTRWNWSELGDLEALDVARVTDAERQLLRELTIAEFGTLPAIHNFLREWSDEYSFSSWAVLWGAEEARHSVVQARILRKLGIEVPAKHALYKREPYPMGHVRAATLMMNIVSESRAAVYYGHLAKLSEEPTLKQAWTLLGRDEARHARAFFTFCKEACDRDPANRVAALKMAYVWLADRSNGLKHPSGFFYQQSTSVDGLRFVERTHEGMTDTADGHVLAMIRKLVDDASIRSVRDIKAWLRAYA